MNLRVFTMVLSVRVNAWGDGRARCGPVAQWTLLREAMSDAPLACDGTAIAGDFKFACGVERSGPRPYHSILRLHHHHLPARSDALLTHDLYDPQRRPTTRMPYVEIPAAAAPDRVFAHHPLFELVARDARSFTQTQTTVSNLQLSLLNQSLNGFFRRYFPPSYASRNDLVPPSYGLD